MNTFFTYFLKNELCPYISTSISMVKIFHIVLFFLNNNSFSYFINLLSAKNISLQI